MSGVGSIIREFRNPKQNVRVCSYKQKTSTKNTEIVTILSKTIALIQILLHFSLNREHLLMRFCIVSVVATMTIISAELTYFDGVE